eukprot:1154253-Pelagomonas_calceolata.AAC.2
MAPLQVWYSLKAASATQSQVLCSTAVVDLCANIQPPSLLDHGQHSISSEILAEITEGEGGRKNIIHVR